MHSSSPADGESDVLAHTFRKKWDNRCYARYNEIMPSNKQLEKLCFAIASVKSCLLHQKQGHISMYPARELVALARLILYQYESHIQVELDAWNESDDDDASTDAGLILDDIHNLNYFIDRRDGGIENRAQNGSGALLCDIHNPKQPERALINIGDHKAKYLFADAVKFRKETRGQPSNGEENWDKEDVLLDFILFLSQPEHKNLFAVGT